MVNLRTSGSHVERKPRHDDSDVVTNTTSKLPTKDEAEDVNPLVEHNCYMAAPKG